MTKVPEEHRLYHKTSPNWQPSMPHYVDVMEEYRQRGQLRYQYQHTEYYYPLKEIDYEQLV